MEESAVDVPSNPEQDPPAPKGNSSLEKSRLEEHHSEEDEQGENLGGRNRDIACRCVSIVERLTGMPREFPELAKFKKKALQTALGTLIQLFSQGSLEETEVILDANGVSSH